MFRYGMVRYVVLAAALGLVLGGAPGFAQDAKPQPAKNKGSVKEKLSKVVDMMFEEVPLDEVVDALKSKLDIPFVLDVKALEEAGVTPDQPISLHVPKVRTDVGLKLMLEPLDLAVDYSTGVARITTKEKARTIVQTRFYDVRDLISLVEQDEIIRRRQFGSPSPEAKNQDGAEPALAERLSGRGPAMMSAKDAVAKPAPKLAEFHPADAVRKLVMDTVDPGSWQDRGGVGRATMLAGVMVVVQTSDAHDQIEETLSQVRAILKTPPGSQSSAKPAGAEGHDDPFGR